VGWTNWLRTYSDEAGVDDASCRSVRTLHILLRTPVAFIPKESVRKSLIRAKNLISCVSWWVGPDFSHLVSEAGCLGKGPLRRGWRGELYLSLYCGKVRLYIPLYIYIVVSLGFWRKGQISAGSLQTPASCPGVCKSIFPTTVRAREEWGELWGNWPIVKGGVVGWCLFNTPFLQFSPFLFNKTQGQKVAI
jgi:hypothetical protein